MGEGIAGSKLSMGKQQQISPFLLVAFSLVIALFVFRHYGGSIWGPVKLKLEGKRTVSDVLSSLEPGMYQRFENLGDLTDGQPIAILAFKEEKNIELWKQEEGIWKFIKDYPFTAYSGELGPKLREGDLQIPEGLYKVEYLNPNSFYHLSLKIDYPNSFDRHKAKTENRSRLGDDIFIHGSLVTVGCIPVGNESIEEIFYLIAKNGYPNTIVIISPYDMRKKSKTLEIEGVTWEEELYYSIATKLKNFSLSE
ncbi:MAG: L,D-transpeptidase family protein [Verrucomicrobiota bacterium]